MKGRGGLNVEGGWVSRAGEINGVGGGHLSLKNNKKKLKREKVRAGLLNPDGLGMGVPEGGCRENCF